MIPSVVPTNYSLNIFWSEKKKISAYVSFNTKKEPKDNETHHEDAPIRSESIFSL